MKKISENLYLYSKFKNRRSGMSLISALLFIFIATFIASEIFSFNEWTYKLNIENKKIDKIREKLENNIENGKAWLSKQKSIHKNSTEKIVINRFDEFEPKMRFKDNDIPKDVYIYDLSFEPTPVLEWKKSYNTRTKKNLITQYFPPMPLVKITIDSDDLSKDIYIISGDRYLLRTFYDSEEKDNFISSVMLEVVVSRDQDNILKEIIHHEEWLQ